MKLIELATLLIIMVIISSGQISSSVNQSRDINTKLVHRPAQDTSAWKEGGSLGGTSVHNNRKKERRDVNPDTPASPTQSWPITSPPGCRDRSGKQWSRGIFRRRSCCDCFRYLFQAQLDHLLYSARELLHEGDPDIRADPERNSSSGSGGLRLRFKRIPQSPGSDDAGDASADNNTTKRIGRYEQVSSEEAECAVLLTSNNTANVEVLTLTGLISSAEGVQWQECCDAAEACCAFQIANSSRHSSPVSGYAPEAEASAAGATAVEADAAAAAPGRRARCDATWDGYSCWSETTAGSDVRQSCPKYLPHGLPKREAIKQCTEDGRWFEKDGLPWTDYTPCLDRESYMNSVYTCLGFNILSISLLIPAIAIFCLFSDLQRQLRIRMHIHFFASLTLNSVTTSLWYMLVHYELLTNLDNSTTVIHHSPAWCRLLAIVKLYSTSATYFWMLCEGCYLYRLLSCAFEQPESLKAHYILGWIGPAIGVTVYGCIRAAGIQPESCWVWNTGVYEWVIYAPNLLCLLLNVLFLVNILRILLFQLHTHPQEPSTFRRGLKAGLMLIPLFGLHLLLTIYRPDTAAPGGRHYEYISMAIANSQGVFVSFIFCFFNDEVLAHCCRHLPSCCRRSRCCSRRTPAHRSTSHVTSWTLTDDRRSDNSLKSRSHVTSTELATPGGAEGQKKELLLSTRLEALGRDRHSSGCQESTWLNEAETQIID